MLVRYVLLALPIHQRSFAAYYEAHDREVGARQGEVEREWGGVPFEQLPAHIRLGWKDRWYWPPWFFNDIVGYLKIGTVDDTLLATSSWSAASFRRQLPSASAAAAPARRTTGRSSSSPAWSAGAWCSATTARTCERATR
jgi:hypothetical protein